MQVLALQAAGFKILIPVKMVAQIVGVMPVSRSQLDFPSVAGNINWRDYPIPLLNSSELMTQYPGADDDYQRIVILWPIKPSAEGSFLAFTSLDSPDVLNITDTHQWEDAEGAAEMDYALGVVQLEGDLGLVPDLAQINKEIYRPV